MMPGTVVRYHPDQNHCREGYAIANDRGVLFDTYWQWGGDQHRLTPEEEAGAEVIFNLNDYDRVEPWVWRDHNPADRQRVTSQHGYEERLFVRKGSAPDVETQIANAENEVREAERELEHAKWRLECERRALAQVRDRCPAADPSAGMTS